MFQVLREYTEDTSTWSEETKHLQDRDTRLAVKHSTKRVTSFLVDKGHPHGPEVHTIMNDATIYIYNERTKRFITVLYGRPQQIKRYYEAIGKVAPQRVLNSALHNIKTGRNNR